MGDVGPAANAGEPVGEGLDVAADIVEARDLGGEPFVRDVAPVTDVAEHPADHARMVHRPDLAEIGKAARGPQAPGRDPTLYCDRRILGDVPEHGEVDGFRSGTQQRVVTWSLEAGDEGGDVGEVEVGVAPIKEVERAEAMLFDRLDFMVCKLGAVVAKAERSEGAVALVATRAARDLRHLGDGQAAVAAAVELFEPGEGDMGDIHVEPHADGVRGNEIVDLAALEHGHLGVAGCRRKRAHDHSGAAAESSKRLGERVNLLGGECDDGGARRQTRQLDAAGIA